MSELDTLHVKGGAEWTTNPDLYFCDSSIYRKRVDEAIKILERCGGNKLEFWYVEESDGAELSGGSQEPTWLGPHLSVTASGATLYWESKYTNDKIFVELPDEHI